MAQRDPIIDEIHKIREEIAKAGDYDLEKIAAAAREREKAGGREVVTLPPRRPKASRKAS